MNRPSNYSFALVVEKDPTIQKYIADYLPLKVNGVQVKTAINAEEAVKLIRLFPYAVLVCNERLATSSKKGNVLDVAKSYKEKCKEAGGGVYIPIPSNAKSKQDIEQILEEYFK